MAELPDELFEEVTRLSEEGNQHQNADRLDEALVSFHAALALLPHPASDWDAALWLWAGIGDVLFQQGRFAVAREPLMEAMVQFDEARGNPFLRLRLGQCLYELGELDAAESWLAGAYLLADPELFEDEDPKYLAFARSRLEPPAADRPE